MIASLFAKYGCHALANNITEHAKLGRRLAERPRSLLGLMIQCEEAVFPRLYRSVRSITMDGSALCLENLESFSVEPSRAERFLPYGDFLPRLLGQRSPCVRGSAGCAVRGCLRMCTSNLLLQSPATEFA